VSCQLDFIIRAARKLTSRRHSGILGYGAVGRQVGRVAKAVGMEIFAYTNKARHTSESKIDTRFRLPGLGDAEGKFPTRWFSHEESELAEFLASGLDVLVVCVPQTPLTKNLLSKEQFKLLADKRTYLSNCSRGPIVNTNDLITALSEGWIRGAALDVTDPEPLPQDHPLWRIKNVVITPHVSSYSTKAGARFFAILDHNLQRLSQGGELLNVVSREKGY
jgi:phosphoglycerate dehydrogenase-like enzyme